MQSGRPRIFLSSDISFAYCRPIYMDRLQDYFSSHCKPLYSLPFHLHPLTPCFIDCLCLCNGTCTIIIQITPVLDIGLVSFTLIQSIQPSSQLRRRQTQSSLASSSSRANNQVPGYCPALGRRRVVSIIVINLRPKPRSDDRGPRGRVLHS